MICDCFLYNGEREILEIRLNILDKFVDRFIIMEATQTFSGKPKPLYFERDKDLFKKWEHKIKYCVLDKWDNEEVWKMARESPNTQYGKGAKHWLQEFYIKEHLKDCLTDLDDENIVMIGDCDEIVDPLHYHEDFEKITKFKLRVYTYWLNNRSSEIFWGTIRARYKDIKNGCLNELRNNYERKNTIEECGWHFTNVMNLDRIRDKLNDSYTEESYNTESVQDLLEYRYKNNIDYLGRNFTLKKDESELPKWLLDNKEKYKHLFK